jgi:hypothetical protein
LRNTLKEHFGTGFYLYYWQITDPWGQVVPEVPDTAQCVHGHYQTDVLTGRFPDAQLLTWVREPVERVASSYHHRLREPDWSHPVCHELHTRKLSLEAYAELPLVRDEMTRFFGSKRPADFAFIGLVERYEESFARLGEFLGFSGRPARRDNVNPDRRNEGYEIDPGVRRAVEALNAQDVSLYSECVARVDRFGR